MRETILVIAVTLIIGLTAAACMAGKKLEMRDDCYCSAYCE